MSDTPETDASVQASGGDWSPVLRAVSQRLERELDKALMDRSNGDIATMTINHYERILKERDEAIRQFENLKAAAIHTCHEQCQRPMCVLRRERDEAREQLRKASVEANTLATSIQKTEYPNAKEFELLGSVAGVISQIDNMYAGVRQQRDEAREAFIEARKHREQFNSLLQSYEACWEEIKTALGEPEEGDQTCDLDRVLKAIRERDEAREDLEFRRGLYKVQEQYLETARRERDKAQVQIKELIYIAERAIDLAEIDFENDKFGVVSELRDGVQRIKERAK